MERRCFRLQYVVKKQKKFFHRSIWIITAVSKTEDSGGFLPVYPRQ